MRIRLSRKLAGCTGIELLLAGVLLAADPAFHAGTAALPGVSALAIQDRHGHLAVFAAARFPITRAVSDLVSARLLQDYEIDRGGILLRGQPGEAGRPGDLDTVIAGAIGKLAPASLRYAAAGLSVTGAADRCLGSLQSDGSLVLDRCSGGSVIRGEIRSAFQMFEPAHSLLQREAAVPAYPLQVIAIGRDLVVLALGGPPSPAAPKERGLLVVPFANDDAPLPGTPEIAEAIRKLLQRVR